MTSPPELPRVELAPGYDVPRLIHGGWQLSEGHRTRGASTEETLRALERVVDAGYDTFDCGDIYTGVEALLGRLRRTRRGIRVHTKFVPDRDDLASLRREDVARIVDRSLRRLGVERLDLVQFAWWDFAVRGYVEAAGWLDELRVEGKIRLLGATNFDVPRLREIVDAGVPVIAHQVQYSVLDRRPERGMVEFCRERGIRLLAYGSLAGGFLTGRYVGASAPEGPLANRSLVKYRLMIDELGGWARFQDLLEVLAEIARVHRDAVGGAAEGPGETVDVARVALRWVLDRPGVAAAIVGGVGDAHVASNRRTFAFELADDDLERLAAFGDAGPAGDVYTIERDPDGPHAAIMRYDLNRRATD